MSDAAVLEKQSEEKTFHIKGTDFGQAEYPYPRFQATLPAGTPFEEVLKPEAWSIVAHKLAADPQTRMPAKIGIVVEIRTEDHAYYAEVYVRGAQKQALYVQTVLGPIMLGPQKKTESKTAKVRWNPGKKCHEVMRLSDNTIIQSDFQRREQAEEWLNKTREA